MLAHYIAVLIESMILTGDCPGQSIWTTGYVIGQIPSNLLLTRVSPRWVIPSLELLWGIATISASALKDIRSLYAMRFFIGFLE